MASRTTAGSTAVRTCMYSVNQQARLSSVTDSSCGKSCRPPSSARYVNRCSKGCLHCGQVGRSRCAAQRRMHFTATPAGQSRVSND